MGMTDPQIYSPNPFTRTWLGAEEHPCEGFGGKYRHSFHDGVCDDCGAEDDEYEPLCPTCPTCLGYGFRDDLDPGHKFCPVCGGYETI
jgi:hypothetical protein